MKSFCNRTTLPAVISFFVLLAATSCKKSNSGGSGGGNSLSASVSGSGWSTSFPTVGTYISLNQEFEILGLQVKGGDSTAVALWFDAPFRLNVAMNSDTANVDVNYVEAKTGVEWDGGSDAGWSILTVTSYDSASHTIGGTFNGVLYQGGVPGDSLVITNGKFNTTYSVQ